jgi:RHS repeat-associated protein
MGMTAVIWNISATAADQIYVAIGNGRGFDKATLWLGGAAIPNLTLSANKFARLIVRDINGDHLDDIILDVGQDATATNCATYPTSVFVSSGTSFLAPVGGQPGITSLANVGDLNGDGLLDFLSVGANGSVRYGSGGVPNLLTAMVDPSGGETRVTYAPSSAGGNNNNKIPGVMQLVSAIETRSGTGSVDVVTYSYTNGVYDYENRKPLGYNTVTAQFPAVAGETAGPIVTTMYENASFWMHGAVKSENVRVGSTSYSNTFNTWATTGSGRGPYRFDKVSERVSTAYGGAVIETRRDYTYNLYGQIATVLDYGFTSAGANNTVDDDMIVSIDYEPNAGLYIVDKPKVIRTQRGNVSSWDLTTFLKAEFFRYDGNAQHFQIPLRGNLTEYLHWTGDLTGLYQRSIRKSTYDAYGNVLTETDARTNVTTHTYDTTKRLFRLTTTNALGHAAQTVWNTGCQLPLSVTDANGLITSFAYDLHCRESRRDLPNGQYLITRYANFGTPTTQFIERESKSASTVAGRTIQLQREYFDGLGRVYKTTSPGTLSVNTDAIVQLRGHDARGNLAWQSIPLTWTAALSNTATAAQRTTFSYDPLNRPLRETYADGTYQTTTYVTQSFTSAGTTAMLHPGITIKDAHCFDAAATTVCGETSRYMDDHGNTVRQVMQDTALTDVGGPATPARNTDYRYDHLDRLIAITDPAGATWTYTYDIFGNRRTADDPGLGAWSMSYNWNNLLTQQTDAKGQVITFAYDALNRPTLKTVGTGTTRVETRFTYDQIRAGYHNIGQQTTQEVWAASTATTTARVERDYHTTGAVQVERHTIDGRTYALESSFAPNGAMLDQRLPNTPGATTTAWVGAYTYDAANRMTAMAGRVTSVTYDLRSQPTRTDFANGTWEIAAYNPARGWLNAVDGYLPGAAPLFRAAYTRSATGRISQYDTGTAANDAGGSYNYTYDYAGRLLTAANFRSAPAFDQVMAYDSAGRIRAKGPTATQTTAYAYGGTAPDHAPQSVTTAGVSTAFTYDANGNMAVGLGGRTMTYDGENRPLSVTVNNKRTCYVYGVDGTRLKKIENLAANANCAALPTTAVSTVYFGAVEVRNWLVPGQEQVLTYPSAAVKLTNGVASYLHRDHLGSVRAITDAAGVRVESAVYKPFGEQTEFVTPGLAAPESKGWIGERYDADAGLQYLNARYYDPVLGMFLQPDWFEVLKPGVGTNRFSYSFNDPVNKLDPMGNFAIGNGKSGNKPDGSLGKAIGDFFERLASSVFGDRQSRNQMHMDNARTELGLARGMLEQGHDFYDPVVQEHFANAKKESRRVGSSALEEAWEQVFGPAVDAALIGSAAAIGVGTKVVGATSPYAVGQLGENAVRAVANIGPKPTTAILMSGRLRLPDGLTATVLSEVKNVATLSYTRQLRDFASYAAATGRTFDVYTRTTTVLSGPLRSAIQAGEVVQRFIP